MSLSYKTGLVYGWRVNEATRNDMNIHSHYEFENDFIPINSYEDNPYYIFGVWITSLNGVGKAKRVDTTELEFPSDFIEEFEQKWEKCGRKDWIMSGELPELYLIQQVT